MAGLKTMEIILFLQSYKTPFLDYLFQRITMLGEQSFFIILACWFTWCYDKETGWRAGFIFLTGIVLNSVLKDIFCIQRPIGKGSIISQRIYTAGGYSFPSGHTQNAALFWGALMKIYRKKFLYISGTVIVILVGVSRLYLGVHWPSDVIGGALIGAVWVFAADYAWRKLKIAENKISAAFVISIMIILCIIYPGKYIIRVTGAATGFLFGIYLEKRYLNYTVSGGIISSVLKMLSGLAVLAAIIIGSKELFPSGAVSNSTTFALVGFWITFGAPALFTRIAKIKIQDN